jgi:hypothetical protein
MKLVYIQLFVVSFLVGCIFVYLSPVEHKTVMVYPTPKNCKKIQYKDDADQCFQFSAKLVNCKGRKVDKIKIQ